MLCNGALITQNKNEKHLRLPLGLNIVIELKEITG